MVTTLGAASIPLIVVDHDHGLPAVPAARRALGDDARAHRRRRRPTPIRRSGRVAAARAKHVNGHHRVGVLARLVPGRAAEHDPGVVLPRRPLRPEHDVGLHADRHVRSPGGRSASRSSASCCFFIPAYLGIRFGAGFATVLGAAVDDPADVPGGRLDLHRRRRLGPAVAASTSSTGRGFFTGLDGHGWFTFYIALRVPADLERDRDGGGRLLHRRDARTPTRDAKIAMNLEGAYGLVHLHADPDRASSSCSAPRRSSNPRPRRPEHDLRHASPARSFGTGGERPELADRDHADRRAGALGAERDHGLRAVAAPDVASTASSRASSSGSTSTACRRARWASTSSARCWSSCSAARSRSTSFSNVGYTGSFIPVLIGYYLLRKYRPTVRAARSAARVLQVRRARDRRPVRVHLAATAGSATPRIGNTEIYYFLGWAWRVAYIPLYLYRTRVEDKQHGRAREPDRLMPQGAVPSK